MRIALLALVSCFLAPDLSAQPGFVNEFGDADELVAKAQPATGNGAFHSIVGLLNSQLDVDMYVFRIINPNTFSVSTDVPITQGPNGINDTQLSLWDCHGRGISFNDDIASNNLRSRIDGQHLTAGGVYTVAVTSFGNHPLNSSNQPIYNHQGSWTSVNPPNGPGAANPILDSWDHQGTESGNYGIMTTGGELLGSGAPINRSVGLGCGGLELCPETLPILGSSFGFTISGPGNPGVTACLARPGGLAPFGLPLPAPVMPGCLGYLGNQPTVNLGLSTQPSQTFTIPLPNNPVFSGLPIALQGARFDPGTFQVRTSNGLEGTLGDCN